MQPLQLATPVKPNDDRKQEMIQHAIANGYSADSIEDDIEKEFARQAEWECWMNDTYVVRVKREDDMAVLSIRRVDRAAPHDWRDFQDIKNQLVGHECEAVELYPAESRLVDTANQFYLWCVTDTAYKFPFGFGNRFVTDTAAGGAVQRPRPRS